MEAWKWFQWGDLITDYQQGAIRSNNELGVGDTRYLKMGDLDGEGSYNYLDLAITESTPKEINEYELHEGDFLINVRNSREIVGKSCVIDIIPKETIFNHMLVRIGHKKDVPGEYINAWLNTEYVKRFMDGIKTGTTTIIALYQADLYRIPILVPPKEQLEFSTALIKKVERKKRINQEITLSIKAFIKLLFEKWFIQFDFPDENGNPYRSSGGRMVYSDTLGYEIPYGWEVDELKSFVKEYGGGDWGQDSPDNKCNLEVKCIRGADIENMTDLPTRFVNSNSKAKLLRENDIVVEISGGSPIQATGRSVLITEGILSRNNNKVLCTNFCQNVKLKNEVYAAYFFYVWNELYDSGNMFNFEGKTSGIKNLQIDALLSNPWYIPPLELAEKFSEFVKNNYSLIDAGVVENKFLDKIKKQLYPILLNGQVII